MAATWGIAGDEEKKDITRVGGGSQKEYVVMWVYTQLPAMAIIVLSSADQLIAFELKDQERNQQES
uniref:Uncharacterized protein n=1 Tax=Oryza punctata TaxID=4537 RepID=A0A0E0MD64_ORYPU